MNRKFLLLIGMVALLALAGCSEAGQDAAENANEVGDDANADVSNVEFGGSYIFEAKFTEKNQLGLVKAQPPFKMESSLERANLIERYKYLNDESNEHYVYFLANDGGVISFMMAQGKVSSVNSKLTNDRQPVRLPNCDPHKSGNDCWKMVESPQMDGSYGTNGDAIFFFTPEGNYVEYNGKYVVSEVPLNIQTPVSLVSVEDFEGNSIDQSEVENQTNESSTTNETGE